VHISAKTECAPTHRQTKVKTVYLPVSLCSLSGYNYYSPQILVHVLPAHLQVRNYTLLPHFCTFLINPHCDLLRSWIWLYRQKDSKMTFPTISCPYRNTINFSRMSRIHFSANNMSFRPFKPQWRLDWVHTDTHTDRQKWKTVYPPVSLYALGGYNKMFILYKAPCGLSVTAELLLLFYFVCNMLKMWIDWCTLSWNKVYLILNNYRLIGFYIFSVMLWNN